MKIYLVNKYDKINEQQISTEGIFLNEEYAEEYKKIQEQKNENDYTYEVIEEKTLDLCHYSHKKDRKQIEEIYTCIKLTEDAFRELEMCCIVADNQSIENKKELLKCSSKILKYKIDNFLENF